MGEVRLRRLRLADYRPEPLLVTPSTYVPRARVPAVDVHNHLGRWLTPQQQWMVADVDALVAAMDDLGLAAVVNLDGRWGDELEENLDRYDRRHPSRFATFCQLDWSLLARDGSSAPLVAQLERAAAVGAVGLKVWKDLGLSVRDRRGGLVAVDDARLSDVWSTAGRLGLPVLIHTADPMAFWRPLDRHNERFEELARHPSWHHRPGRGPTHGELVSALESVLAAHRGTTFIGAHLASCAEDLARVGRMLDAHPNLVVDLAAREAELGRQPRAARAFLVRYVDRALWGTDGFPFSRDRYRMWFRLLESADEYFPYSGEPVPPQGRWAVSGLDLPGDVLTAVYAGNARRLIPALGPA